MIATPDTEAPLDEFPTPPTVTARKVRLRFAKRGDLRLVSHHDLMRCLERLLRRAAIPVAHSQGFNPRPKVVFAQAMALGIEGRREVLDIDLAEPLEPSEVLERLAAAAPPGLEFLEIEAVAPGKTAQVAAVEYELPVPPARREMERAAVSSLLSCESRPYTRIRGEKQVHFDLRPFLLGAALRDDGALWLRLMMTQSGSSARPEEAIDALGLRDLLDAGAILVRTEVELAPAPEPRPNPNPSTPAVAALNEPTPAGESITPATTASERPPA